MSTIGDDLLRESGEVLADGSRFGPKIEALVVYNSNPVAVAPHSGKVVKGFARDDLFTVVLEHFMTDTADLADYVLPATTQLEHLDLHTSYGHTYALINEPAIAPLGEARPNTEIFRELAARWASTIPASPTSDEALAAHRLQAGGAGGFDFADLRAHGWGKLDICRGAVRRGRLRHAERQVPDRCAGPGRPRPRAELRIGREHARARGPLSAGDDLAAGAQLPQLDLRQRHQPARHRGRAVLEIDAGDAAARGIASGEKVRDLQRPRRASLPRRGRAARPAGRGQRPGHLVAQARRATAATSTS